MGLPDLNPLTVLTVGDDAAVWADAGFAVSGGTAVIGALTLRFEGHGAGPGLTGWGFEGRPGGGDLDGIAVVDPPSVAEAGSTQHRNGVIGVDHLVVTTPDVDRTLAALEAVGATPRRRRAVQLGGVDSQQVFCWAGDVILEVVGPANPGAGDATGPAHLWGLTVVSSDLDATVAFLGPRCGSARTVVQPGRRIATVDGRAMGSSVRLAVMDEHRPDSPGRDR